MAVGDLILTNTSLTPEDLDKIAAEVEKDLAANAKDPGQWEQVDSLEGVTSLPVFQVIGATYKLVRVAVSLLKGLDGTNGVDGREVELQVSSTAIQWRYSGTTGWTDLIQLSELKGEKGDKGDTGDTGDKGDQIVLRKTSTAIQWKYDSEEDTAYRDLILLADIKGDKGDTGNTPILETVEVTNGETPSGTFTKTGDDESGNPKYKLSLVVQKGKDGQPPIFEQGTTTTVSPDTEASVEVVANGTSEEGNPKYVLNFSIPKGRDGQDGQGSGNVYIEPTGLLASKKYLFQPSHSNSANGTFVEYVEPNNFPEAPDDGKAYGRNGQTKSWVANPTKVSELENDSKFVNETKLTESLKGKADTTAIPTNVSQLTNDSGYLTDAPKDDKQYARKNGAWAEVEDAGTQYLDLSIFSETKGTLSEEDYQKIVNAYNNKTNIGFVNIQNGALILYGSLSISFYFQASYIINIYRTHGGNAGQITLASGYAIVNIESHSFESNIKTLIDSMLSLETSGSGTKALTDNGQYAEFASPTKVVSGGSGTVTKRLSPNTYYEFGECTKLTITLAAEISGILNEYMFEFVSGSTATTLSLPASVSWMGGKAPTIEANKTYQCSIVNNIAVIGGK